MRAHPKRTRGGSAGTRSAIGGRQGSGRQFSLHPRAHTLSTAPAPGTECTRRATRGPGPADVGRDAGRDVGGDDGREPAGEISGDRAGGDSGVAAREEGRVPAGDARGVVTKGEPPAPAPRLGWGLRDGRGSVASRVWGKQARGTLRGCRSHVPAQGGGGLLTARENKLTCTRTPTHTCVDTHTQHPSCPPQPAPRRTDAAADNGVVSAITRSSSKKPCAMASSGSMRASGAYCRGEGEWSSQAQRR